MASLSDIRLRPSGYGFFLFVLAGVNLVCFLVQRSAEMTSLLNGYMLVPYVNHTMGDIRGCDGIWSCARISCQMDQQYNKKYPWGSWYFRLDLNGQDTCSPYARSWLMEWDYTKAALIVLLVSSGLQLLALLINLCSSFIDKISNRLGFKIVLTLRVLAFLGLLTSYILSYIWDYDVHTLMGDYPPGFVQGWTMAQSGLLLLVTLWSLIPEPQNPSGYQVIQ